MKGCLIHSIDETITLVYGKPNQISNSIFYKIYKNNENMKED